jgi:ATP-binding cassette subfamily C protein
LVSFEFLKEVGEPNFAVLGIFLVGGVRLLSAFLPIQRAAIDLRSLKSQAVAAQDFLGSLEQVHRNPVSASYRMARNSGLGVSIQDVSFSYPDSPEKTGVLKSISMEIEEGSFVALVGPSGSGKSTLVDIILSLHSPTSGQVFLDKLSPENYIALNPGAVGYVPQRPGIVSGTIRDNIALGVPSPDTDVDRVWEVLEQAGMADFVSSLPDGIDTSMGKDMDDFSGGQLQRIGLARALYSDPSLLVLDEATSGLDAETELEISDSLSTRRAGTTVLAVAHRLSTVQNADKIYVLDGGSQVASGSFGDLRRSSTLFRKYIEILNMGGE